MYCQNCGAETQSEQRFCGKCGAELLNSESPAKPSAAVLAAEKKPAAAQTAGISKRIKIIVIALVAIVFLSIVTHIHRCPECEKVYFGKSYTISWFGETEKVCKDCYRNYYLIN